MSTNYKFQYESDSNYIRVTDDGDPVWAVELTAAIKELSEALRALAEVIDGRD